MDKKILIIGAVVIILLIAGYFVLQKPNNNQINNQNSMQNNAQELKVETLTQGSGAEAKTGDKVTVNYTGSLTDGTVFDSNTDAKFNHVQPFTFTLGQNSVIAGWEQGVLGMKVGEKRKLTIPPDLGYGASGAGTVIPPNATLIFEVELVKIN